MKISRKKVKSSTFKHRHILGGVRNICNQFFGIFRPPKSSWVILERFLNAFASKVNFDRRFDFRDKSQFSENLLSKTTHTLHK